jgi:hypothetical protein
MPHWGIRDLIQGLSRQTATRDAMPSLVRFLVVCAILAGIVGAAMFYLATFVEPNTREMTIRIPADKLGL